MEIKHANGFKRDQESAQRVGLLGLRQVQDAPRPVLAEDDNDKILVDALTQPLNSPRSPHPGLTPLQLHWAPQPGGTSPASRARDLPQDQPQTLPNSSPPSCVS